MHSTSNKKVHTKKLTKPWITPTIEKLINNKNKRFKMKRKKQ